jgi:predicted enzyme related to lactoylglutathione lyase
MGNPVVHFEVIGRDGEALQRFYRDAFGWDIQPAVPGYAMAMPGGESGINGGIGDSPDGGPGHVTFYVEVDDLNAALEKVQSLGGSKLTDPMDIPDGPSIAMFADPEGHVIGLAKSGTRRGG